MPILKMICKFNKNPIPAAFCVEIDKLLLKLMWKAKNLGYPK